MRKRSRQEEPFQMAPMIDMVFLLLVFFMTVSTMAKDARPELDLPLSKTAEVVEAAQRHHQQQLARFNLIRPQGDHLPFEATEIMVAEKFPTT